MMTESLPLITIVRGIITTMSRESPYVMKYDNSSNILICNVFQERRIVEIIGMKITQNDYIWLNFLQSD